MVYTIPTFDLGAALGQGAGQGITQGVDALLQRQGQEQKANRIQQALASLSPEQQQDPFAVYQALSRDPEIAESLVRSLNEKQKIASSGSQLPGGPTAQPIPQEISSQIQNVIRENPDADSDELSIKMDAAGIPRIFSNSFIVNRRRKEEAKEKKETSKEEAIRKEVLPIKQAIAEKGNAAREGILNKEQLHQLIDTNKLNDPTFAAFATSLPFNLGERLLSDETVAYRGGLIDEFKDLKTIFKGQTRTAELDLLQKKVADIYLTDSQKKSVLKSRVNALKADVIREEAAAEVEEKYPNLGIFQFQKKVDEIAKTKLEALFHNILDEQNAIIDAAERAKNTSLDPNDPEDRQILNQILKEAKGDKRKARQIAKEKGYKF